MESQISKIIAKHGLIPGQPMKNVHGEDIDGSVVLSNYTVVLSNKPSAGYTLINERALEGTEQQVFLTEGAFAILQSVKI